MRMSGACSLENKDRRAISMASETGTFVYKTLTSEEIICSFSSIKTGSMLLVCNEILELSIFSVSYLKMFGFLAVWVKLFASFP